MINKIFNHFVSNKSKYLLVILLFASLVVRAWYSFRYDAIWWDEAVYIDMGKYLATMGKMGYWEFFRPPLLPVFYALLYNIHLPLMLVGKSVVVLASVGLIYLAFLLAEKIRKDSGLWAGLFLSITPVFFYFSKIALSDITSAYIATLALYFFINRKDFISGFLIGVAFLTRFPQGLILVPILLSVLYREYDGASSYFKRVLRSSLVIFGGFLMLVVPYLISNHFFYGSVFGPLIYGNQIISAYYFIYFKGFWFYVTELWHTAPFLFLSALSFIFVALQFKKSSLKNIPLVSVFITAVVFCAYFFIQPHKELRYGLAFISYLAVLSGVGLGWILEKVQFKKLLYLMLLAAFAIFLFNARSYVIYREVDQYKNFYAFFENKSGVYISTTPVPAVNSKILISHLFENYNYSQKSLDNVLSKEHDNIDGVIVNSCDMFCVAKETGGSCDKEISIVYKKLEDNFNHVYSENVGECNASVFEKIK